ncbi:hypothetical protein Tco_0497026 [Tanacetum coccineum]
MHIFIGCFVYVVDFMILEDLGSIIDSGLSEPFVHASKLTYDESLGLIRQKLISEEYIVNAQNESNLSITYNDINIELNKEFLVELHKNAYHGWIDEDVMEHIAKVLEMIDLIYIPGVDSHQLRMKVFPLSLADDAKEWWISEGDGKITTWEELVETFLYRFYLKSYDGEDEMLEEGNN